jgi:hypothetical protein
MVMANGLGMPGSFPLKGNFREVGSLALTPNPVVMMAGAVDLIKLLLFMI